AGTPLLTGCHRSNTLLRTATADADILRAGGAVVTGTRVAVDDAVAVVVEAVAGIRRLRVRPAAAGQRRRRRAGVGAHRRPELADADVRAALLADVRRHVVLDAVAVVVDAVAHLGERDAALAAAGHVVDDAVAVVVDAVAHLGARGARGERRTGDR